MSRAPSGGVTHGVKRVKDRDASSGRRTRPVVSELKTPKSRRTLSLTPHGHLPEGDKRAAAESMTRALFGG